MAGCQHGGKNVFVMLTYNLPQNGFDSMDNTATAVLTPIEFPYSEVLLATMASRDISAFSKRLLVESAHFSGDFSTVTIQNKVSPTQGFHLTSTTTIYNLTTLASDENCFAASLQLVPPDFIVDEYELEQRYKEGYGPLCHVVGEKDLELPVEAVGERSALVLAEFPIRPETILDVPLHLRYARPQKDKGTLEAELPWPWIIFGCNQPGRCLSLYRALLTYPVVEWNGQQFARRIFEGKPTGDYHVISSPSNTPHRTSSIIVPTGNTSHQPWVELGTVLSVLLTFFYVLWCLFKSVHTPQTKIKTN